jgi:hypothetical protein
MGARLVRSLVIGGPMVGLVGAGLWANLVPLILRTMTPDRPFADQTPPLPPAYEHADHWSALPNDSKSRPVPSPTLEQGRLTEPAADVFFVHSTSYLGSDWNGPVDDEDVRRMSDEGGVLIQASAFQTCCAIYAPYYRQANGVAFYRPSPDGDRAIDLAYGDVSAAFDAFLVRRGTDRPFFVVAHSQGSVLAERLIAERIAGGPLRARLVAAYLVGGVVTTEGVAPDAPPCRTADDLGCVIAWNARRPGFVETELGIVRRRPEPLLCTNPLHWTTAADAAPASANLGALFLDNGDVAPRPGFASARCADGILWVDEVGKAPRNFLSRILDRALGVGNLHPIEYQLYWSNIQDNARVRLDAYSKRENAGQDTANPTLH